MNCLKAFMMSELNMRIDILTLFPQMFAPLQESMVKRAVEKGIVEINVTNIRDYALDKHHITDDRLYGGGAGMVMKPEPIYNAVENIPDWEKHPVIITSPQGKPFDQKMAEAFAAEKQLTIICGHYEGIDERIIEALDGQLVSLGDFVLTGGEIPALAITDSVVRLLPGALGHEEAALEESFSAGLLEYPQYTRPPVFRDREVPDILLSGDHAKIAKWRRQESLKRTLENRPELLEEAELYPEDLAYLDRLKEEKTSPFNILVSLVHYPVYNKKREIVGTSLTNLDLHDIARASATFGVKGYSIVQPADNQRNLIQDLLDYWQNGFGASYNPHRREAFETVRLSPSFEETCEYYREKYGELKLIATSAKASPGLTGYKKMRELMEKAGGNYLLILGTGWGLTDELIEKVHYRLRPIYGKGEYNHLSVRSAASIMLDRLLGEHNAR